MNKEKTSQSRKKIVIISVAIAILVAIVVSVILIVSLLGGKRVYRFDYLGEDLSKYIQISESDYKGYTLTVKMGDITEKSVDEYILQILYEYKSENADTENHGKTVPITAGDTVEIWYRGYLLDENGKEIDLDEYSNMDSATPKKLGIGEGALPLGVESSLVGVVIADYESLEDARREAGEIIEPTDVVYVSYRLLSPTDGETSVYGVRVDLSRDDVDNMFGEGFRDAIVGKAVPEEKATIGSFTADTEDGKLVYNDVKIDVAYPKASNVLTVEARLPYDYEDYELAGSKIYFDIFPHYVTPYDTPEITEKFIKETLEISDEVLAEFEGDDIVSRFRAMVMEELVLSNEEELSGIREEAMWYHYNEVATVIEYPEDAVMAIYTFDLNEITTVWNSYDYTSQFSSFDEFACAYLSLTADSDWRAKLMDDAKAETKEKLIFYYIIKREGLCPTDEEYAALYEEILDEYVVYYMEDKTEEDFDSPEAYAAARQSAEESVLLYYGDEFFFHETYLEFSLDKLLLLAELEIIK